jgi:amidase
MNGIVGLKPTLGLLSQQGIVPIAHSQDTAGPMARSVTDVAILLSAMLPPSACAADKTACIPNFVKSLSPTALRGKRIGVWRFAADSVPRVDALYNKALQVLSGAGATLIELESPNVAKLEAAGFKVMLVEFKAGINDYLANTPRAVTTRSLEQLIAYNRSTPRELTLFGQEIFELANRTNGLADAAYLQALADSKRLSRTEGLDRILAANQLDLIVAPTTATAWRLDLVNGDTFTGSFDTLPAAAGYPHLTVPMGVIRSLPVGLSFIGPANADALLLSAGFAYEQLARFNVTPAFKSTVDQLP